MKSTIRFKVITLCGSNLHYTCSGNSRSNPNEYAMKLLLNVWISLSEIFIRWVSGGTSWNFDCFLLLSWTDMTIHCLMYVFLEYTPLYLLSITSLLVTLLSSHPKFYFSQVWHQCSLRLSPPWPWCICVLYLIAQGIFQSGKCRLFLSCYKSYNKISFITVSGWDNIYLHIVIL